MIGMAGSGKTTIAKEMTNNNNNIIHISSDSLRREILGDTSSQSNNEEIFNEMRSRTIKALNNGKSVVYDATNTNRRRRKALIQSLPKNVKKTAHYIATNYSDTIVRNKKRDRVVPEHVINKMYKTLHIPTYSEGWSDIFIKFNSDNIIKNSTDIRSRVLSGKDGYDIMRILAENLKEFNDIYELPHDSKYHSFSVSRHTYYTYKYMLDNYKGEDLEVMLWTSLLHDIGKPFCKSFITRDGDKSRYANFIHHDLVGGQMAINILNNLGFDAEFSRTVSVIVQFHMYLLNVNASKAKLIDYVGSDLYSKLMHLRFADTVAH